MDAPQPNPEAAKLKSKIAMLQVAYVVLFGISLLVLVGRVAIHMGDNWQAPWAISLGGAVAVRIYRSSLVNKYNAMLRPGGAPAPMV